MKLGKRMMAGVFTAAVLTSSLAGCGSKKDASTTDANKEPETTVEATQAPEESTNTETTPEASAEGTKTIEPCEVIFWHAMSNKQEETLTALTEQFNSENQYGIKVTLVNQGAYNDLSTKLVANAVADTLPDMTQAYNNWIVTYLDKVTALDDFIATDFDNYNDIIEGYREECGEFGATYGLPFNKSTYVLFYNKTLFNELGLTAPTTWEEVQSVGKTLKEKKDMVTIGWDDLAGMFEAALYQNGCDYISEDGALFNTEAGLQTMQYILDLFSNGYARLVGEDGYFSGVLSNQLIGSYVGSSTGASYIDTSSGWELGVAPLPGNVKKGANTAGTNLIMFAKDENQQKATWEYMKFLTSTEATTKWAIETGYLPVRQSAFGSEEYQAFMESDVTAQASYAQQSDFISSKNFEGSYDVRSTVNTKMEEFILNGTDAQTALNELVEAVNADLQ